MAAKPSALRPVHVLSVGDFGRRVAAYLKDFDQIFHQTEVHDDVIPLPAVWPSARINVVAAWRPVPHLCDLLDQLSLERQIPFIPLILHPTKLVLGPVIQPGGTCCWGCWIKRSKQHDVWPKEQTAVMQHYARNPAIGPQGYLVPFALIGAAKIEEAIESIDSAEPIAGATWHIDLMTREIVSSVAIGVHDCPRCGLHRLAETRGFIDMHRDLGYLWAGDMTEGAS